MVWKGKMGLDSGRSPERLTRRTAEVEEERRRQKEHRKGEGQKKY